MSKTLFARLTRDHWGRELLVSVTVKRPGMATSTYEVAAVTDQPFRDFAMCSTLDKALERYAGAFGYECTHEMAGTPCGHNL